MQSKQTEVTVFLAPAEAMAQFYFLKNQNPQWVVDSYRDQYSTAFSFSTDLTGKAACEEAFDITNNPDRQEEREEIYGRGRSVSVGDIVLAGERAYLCLSVGWMLLD